MSRSPQHDSRAQVNLQDLWNDIALTRSGIDELVKQGEQTRDLQRAQEALGELKLKTANYEKLLEEMQAPMRAILGTNFLGTAEWKQGLGVNVGAPPPIPETLTPDLLNSACPLHPGQRIKDSHILMLMPRTVDGQLYSALKLDELCASRTGSGDRLIDNLTDYENQWKRERWAHTSPTESQWILIPKSDPPSYERDFRNKTIAEQAEVFKHYAAEYREAKALEVMTAAVLHDVLSGERIVPNYLVRTKEPHAAEGRVVVGRFNASGLQISLLYAHHGYVNVSFAMAREL
jgi:hypothetical protein